MLSIPDMALLGAAALLLFGPEQLPRVARKAGSVMREIQNTSQSFIREMERAADLQDEKEAADKAPPYEPAAYEPVPYEAAPYEPPPYEPPPVETAPHNDAPRIGFEAVEPPAPDPDPPQMIEKLAEPRPALDLQHSHPAEAAPESDHAPHL